MRRLAMVLGALLLTMGVTVSVGAGEGTQVDALLDETTVLGPGVVWVSDGILHVRDLPVADTVFDRATMLPLGTLTRSVNYNLNIKEGHSQFGRNQAWCTFTMDLGDLGTFDGNCRGTLLAGSINGHGPDGVLAGEYELAAGGTLGLGPYELSMTIK